MAHESHSEAVAVPADFVAERQAGWIAFTQFIKLNCFAITGVLVLLLLVGKVF